MHGRGTVIRRNVFHDDFDGLRVCTSESNALTHETDVYENTVYRMGDDGVETDGDCSNVRIWNNTFHDILMGISLAPARIGPVYAIRNLQVLATITIAAAPLNSIAVAMAFPEKCISFIILVMLHFLKIMASILNHREIGN